MFPVQGAALPGCLLALPILSALCFCVALLLLRLGFLLAAFAWGSLFGVSHPCAASPRVLAGLMLCPCAPFSCKLGFCCAVPMLLGPVPHSLQLWLCLGLLLPASSSWLCVCATLQAVPWLCSLSHYPSCVWLRLASSGHELSLHILAQLLLFFLL